MRQTRAGAELARAADEVCAEWRAAAELAVAAAQFDGSRSVEQQAVITATNVRYRCLANFVAGNEAGNWHSNDVKPFDFLGRDWALNDVDLDRTIRGRLPVLNTEQQHISWSRVDETPTMWSVVNMVHEVSVALDEFVEELLRTSNPHAAKFVATRDHVLALLPAHRSGPETAATPAPPRS